MIPKTTTYYGKKYGLVYYTKSKSEINIYSRILDRIFDEYDYAHPEKLIKNTKLLILVEHNDYGHFIYVKKPFDKIIKMI